MPTGTCRASGVPVLPVDPVVEADRVVALLQDGGEE